MSTVGLSVWDADTRHAPRGIGTVRLDVNRGKEDVGSEVHGKLNPVDVPRGVDLPTLQLPINWFAYRTHRVFLKIEMKPLELEPCSNIEPVDLGPKYKRGPIRNQTRALDAVIESRFKIYGKAENLGRNITGISTDGYRLVAPDGTFKNTKLVWR